MGFTEFLTTVFYQPLYNGLVFVMGALPFGDAGIAVIIFTVIVRLILFPLSRKAVRTQMLMKEYEPELNKIKERNQDDKQQQAQEMMDFYKEKGINPFSSFLLILIQLPILISLYYIFAEGGFPDVNPDMLYSFVTDPGSVSTALFGIPLLSVAGKSWVLALAAGVSGFFQIRYSMPPMKQKTSSEPNFKEDLARSMNLQMRYVFPVIIFFIAWTISGAIALYLFTSNLFTIGQEIVVRKEMGKSVSKRDENTAGSDEQASSST